MSKRLPLIALILISAAAALPLFLNPGFLNTRGGGDSPFLLFRLHQLYSALLQGVFPVRWMPDAAYGLGYPFFSYYAALPLYVAALFKLVGLSYVLSLKLTHLLGFFLAAVGLYGWLRSLGRSRLAAWSAAAVYTFAPFHLVNVFARGDSLNEFWAFAFYPLCLWAVQRIRNNQFQLSNLKSLVSVNSLYTVGNLVLPLAIAYAALLFTHNISALIFSPFLGLYILIVALQPTYPSPDISRLSSDESPSTPHSPHHALRFRQSALFILHCSVGIALGLALAVFFWLPAIRETDFGQFGPVTQGYFNYANHFRGRDLVQLTPVFNFDVGSATSTPFAMGFAQAVLTAIALVVIALRFIFNRPRPVSSNQPADNSATPSPTSNPDVLRLSFPSSLFIVHCSFLILGLLIATFMITRYSEPLWANLPLLPFVQFPWRFLSIQALFTSAFVGFAIGGFHFNTPDVSRLPSNESPSAPRSPLDISLALVSLIACALSLTALRSDFVPITDADVTAERLQLYEYFTGNIGTTINYEYLPQWTHPRPYSSEEFITGTASLKVLNGEASGERLTKRAAAQTWLVNVQSDSAAVAIPLLYWPGWEAKANGQPVTLYPATNGLGWVAVDLPQGEHRLEVTLGNTDLRKIASTVSFITLLTILVLAHPWTLFQSLPPRLIALRLPLAISFVLLVLLIAGGRLLNAREQSVGAATMDFDQQGYLNSSAVRFGNGDVLLGYNYSADSLAPGDTLGVALEWQASTEANYQLDLVSPAEHLVKLPSTFATVTNPISSETAALISIPSNLPTGIYFLRLSVLQGHNLLAPALTLNNQPRGDLYLKPIRVINNDVDPTVTEQPNLIALASLVADQPSPDKLTLTFGWRASAPLAANYLLALRLRDSAGYDLAALDTPPTGGIYPTSAWRVGELVTDHFEFNLPPGLPPGDYPLTLTFYLATDLSAAQTITLPIRLSQWTPPPGTEPAHRFDASLALQDLTIPASVQTGSRLNFTALWTSLAPLSQNYTARWSAVAATGKIVTVEDQPLAVIPTTQWAAGALVMGRPFIKLPISAPEGDYTLNVQLLDSTGDLLSPSVVVGKFNVASSGRTTELPMMQHEAAADLGPLLIAGYDATLADDTLTLTVYARGKLAMDVDYKYFIHIFNPDDESIPAQADGFPTIPTSEWEEDEVVAITVNIPLTDLTPGVVYNIAVGWYDPNTGNRLGDRIILSQGITKP